MATRKGSRGAPGWLVDLMERAARYCGHASSARAHERGGREVPQLCAACAAKVASEVAHMERQSYAAGIEAAASLIEMFDRSVDHPWRLSDCVRAKFNMLDKAKIRRNPRGAGGKG